MAVTGADVVADAPVPPPKKVEHFTPAERAARGKATRAEVPRTSHADWEPSSARPDPIAILEAQAVSREQSLVPIRYGRMLVSPFTFYRGAAALMASDLSSGTRTGLHTQLCGDAHLMNFGTYAAPDRRLVFGINDFDETLPGPFEWDVKRLVASFAVAGRDRAFNPKVRNAINLEVVKGYRLAMQGFAAMRNLDVWYARLDVEALMHDVESSLSPVAVARMERERREGAHEGQPQGVREADPPRGRGAADRQRPAADRPDRRARRRGLCRRKRARPSSCSSARTADRWPSDRRRLLERFRYVDMARKVVGVGSVGTRAWIVLMLGRDGDDPLFLQAKEAQASVLEPYLGKSPTNNHGQRVVDGQRMMQSESDILLGWLRAKGLDGIDSRLLLPPAVGRQGIGPGRGHRARRHVGVRPAVRLDAREGPRALRRRDRDRRRTWARRTRSTRPWRCSPRSTPTRTSATTRRSRRPSSSGRVIAQTGL